MDINRAVEIGHELLAIEQAIQQAKIGHGNAKYAGTVDFDESFVNTELFAALSDRREALREELVVMG